MRHRYRQNQGDLWPQSHIVTRRHPHWLHLFDFSSLCATLVLWPHSHMVTQQENYVVGQKKVNSTSEMLQNHAWLTRLKNIQFEKMPPTEETGQYDKSLFKYFILFCKYLIIEFHLHRVCPEHKKSAQVEKTVRSANFAPILGPTSLLLSPSQRL